MITAMLGKEIVSELLNDLILVVIISIILVWSYHAWKFVILCVIEDGLGLCGESLGAIGIVPIIFTYAYISVAYNFLSRWVEIYNHKEPPPAYTVSVDVPPAYSSAPTQIN